MTTNTLEDTGIVRVKATSVTDRFKDSSCQGTANKDKKEVNMRIREFTKFWRHLTSTI